VCRDSEIEQLKLLIAKLRRMQFGRSSEKLGPSDRATGAALEALQLNDAEKVAALPEAIKSAEPVTRRYGGRCRAPATGDTNLPPKQTLARTARV